MDLLTDERLERSGVVANCRMNRERDLHGRNGYDRELGLDPLAFLIGRIEQGGRAAWLDLCCGTGRALIQAARALRAGGVAPPNVEIVGVDLVGSSSTAPSARMSPPNVEIVGVDLVGLFDRPGPGLEGLRLVEASLASWRPDRAFDLISCVHGLHYVGDKLGLIARAASWLAGGGLFAANLDLANLRLADGRAAGRRVAADLRRAGLEYDRRRRRVLCRGRRAVGLPYRYLGANDRAGPNSTGQPAVDSYYEAVPGPSRPG